MFQFTANVVEHYYQDNYQNEQALNNFTFILKIIVQVNAKCAKQA